MVFYRLLLVLVLWSCACGATDETLPYCGKAPPGAWRELAAPAGVAAGDGERGELVAALTFIRHGARTPGSPCGRYVKETEGAAWDCSLMFHESPVTGSARFARSFASEPQTNDLGGSCESGQLLDSGFEQHRALGAALRRAYRGPNATVASLPMSDIKVRSTDLSRTRASAEALLTALTDDGVITVDTVDFAKDWLYPNSAVCPRLKLLEEAAYASPEFQRWNTSASRLRLDAELGEVLGESWSYGLEMAGGHLLDCLMTAACTGRSELLPRTLTPATLKTLVEKAEYREYFKLKFDDAAYARLTAAPLLHKALEFAERAFAGGGAFALWSAHDTTVMPLEVVLGIDDGRWAPYAHALVVEVWLLDDEKFVRFVRDGRVAIAAFCDGAELCPWHAFQQATAWARTPRRCDVPEALVVDDERQFTTADLAVTAGLSLVVGAAIALLVLRLNRK